MELSWQKRLPTPLATVLYYHTHDVRAPQLTHDVRQDVDAALHLVSVLHQIPRVLQHGRQQHPATLCTAQAFTGLLTPHSAQCKMFIGLSTPHSAQRIHLLVC